MGGVCRTGGNIGKHTEKEKIGNFTLVQGAFAVGGGIGDCLNRGLNGLRGLHNLCGISIACAIRLLVRFSGGFYRLCP